MSARGSASARAKRVVAIVCCGSIAILGLSLLLSRTKGRPVSGPIAARAPGHWQGLVGEASPGGIFGLVVDQSGQPVEGARVIAVLQPSRDAVKLRPSEVLAVEEPPKASVSAHDGGFRLIDLRSGTYLLTAATAEAYAETPARVTVGSDDSVNGIKIVLVAHGFPMTGRVLDVGGGEIVGAVVRAKRLDLLPSEADALIYEGVTRDAGRYALQLPGGRYLLMADASGYASAYAAIDLVGPEMRDMRLQPGGVVAGRVLDESGKLVPEAEVRVESLEYRSEQFARLMTTSERGEFRFQGVAAGPYRVTARKGALVGGTRMSIILAVAETKDDVDIFIAPGATLEGIVKDERGGGVSKAELELVQSDMPAGRAPAKLQATSDAIGHFRFEGVALRSYFVRIHAANFSAVEKTVTLANPSVQHMDFVLSQEASVVGEVLSPAGVPIAAAVVEGRVRRDSGGRIFFDRTKTDAQGKFQLHGLCTGSMQVSVSSTAGVLVTKPEPIRSGETKQLSLRLEDGGRISGVALWEDGTPAPHVTVVAQTRGGMVQVLEVRTNDAGEFAIGPLPAGDTSVHGLAPGQRPFGLDPGDSPQVDLTLAQGEQKTGVVLKILRHDGTLSGVITGPSGNPVPDALVKIFRETDGSTWRTPALTAITTTDGSFMADSLAKGAYTVVASHPEYTDGTRKGVPSGSNAANIVLQQAGTLAGRVELSSGEPARSFSVAAVSSQPPSFRAVEEFQNALGTFELSQLPAGTYDITAVAADGSAGRLGNISLRLGESKRDLRVVATRAATIVGEVKDFGSGKPVEASTVQVRTPTGLQRSESDARGRFRLEGVPRMSGLSIVVQGPDATYLSESRPISTNQSDEVIDVGTLELVRVDKSQQSQPRAYASLDFRTTENGPVMARLRPGSEASAAGFRDGDALVAIDGKDAHGLGENGLRYLLMGPPQSEVALTVHGGDGSTLRELKMSRTVTR